MKKNFLLLIVMLTISSYLKSQTFQAGSYQILLENSMYYDITGTKKDEFTTDKIIVKLKDDLESVDKVSFATRNSLTLLSTTRLGISVYKVNEGTNILTLISNLSSDSDIQYFDLNYLLNLNMDNIKIPYTNDSYDLMSGYLISDSTFVDPYEQIGLFSAWNLTKGNSDIIIGNLDNGIYLNHEDLGVGPDSYTNIWNNMNEIPNNGIDDDNNGYTDDYYGWDFFSNDNDVSHDDPSVNCHGTKSAGIMAAKTNNEIGVFGIAGGWNSNGIRIMNIKTANHQNRPEAASIPKSIEYACENGARVINMPFGVTTEINSIKTTIEDYYYNHNIIFLASTGQNTIDGVNLGVAFPARIECVIAVTGSLFWNDYEGLWAGTYGGKWTANYGPEVDISAPVNPSVRLNVEKDFNNNLLGTYEFIHSKFPDVCGTSWSVAMVSGVVGLMLSVDPCLSADEIIKILHNTADEGRPI